ncbi:MAG: hypothetical protein ACE5J7_01950 [Candidatus Aenigmatarchaeota archaeon]
MEEVIASAPGKMLLLGSYAVLEKPNVGYVVSLNKRVYARVSESENRFEFEFPDFKIRTTADFEGQELVYEPGSERATDFTDTATKLSLRYISEKGYKLRHFKLTTHNNPAFTYQWGKSKSGLGSSSAVTVATIAAILAFHGFDVIENKDTIHKLAQLSHNITQGKVGSGFDIAACVYGGAVYERFSKKFIPDVLPGTIKGIIDRDWDYRIDPLPFPDVLHTIVGYTGSAANTRIMVRKVREWAAKSPDEYAALLHTLNEEDKKAIGALRDINENRGGAIDKFAKSFMLSRKLTRELGRRSGAPIETPELSQMIDAALEAGAIASKLPGAGGGDSIIAIYTDEKVRQSIHDAWKRFDIKPTRDMRIESDGIRMENKFPVCYESQNK